MPAVQPPWLLGTTQKYKTITFRRGHFEDRMALTRALRPAFEASDTAGWSHAVTMAWITVSAGQSPTFCSSAEVPADIANIVTCRWRAVDSIFNHSILNENHSGKRVLMKSQLLSSGTRILAAQAVQLSTRIVENDKTQKANVRPKGRIGGRGAPTATDRASNSP
eukprot:m.158352 g.158352  ORF g.158352 m.158352 type:complete len:165 (-) comp14506_c0_seq3:529-1023(-)